MHYCPETVGFIINANGCINNGYQKVSIEASDSSYKKHVWVMSEYQIAETSTIHRTRILLHPDEAIQMARILCQASGMPFTVSDLRDWDSAYAEEWYRTEPNSESDIEWLLSETYSDHVDHRP